VNQAALEASPETTEAEEGSETIRALNKRAKNGFALTPKAKPK
jgi:hypothetical protein